MSLFIFDLDGTLHLWAVKSFPRSHAKLHEGKLARYPSSYSFVGFVDVGKRIASPTSPYKLSEFG
jgi:hypothetical protein